MSNKLSHAVDHAVRAIYCEADGLNAMASRLKEDASLFNRACRFILDTKGRVIVCGMGKSGIVGKKIAASLASTGTPAFFMHPGEAFHGDLGMVTGDDVFLALSNSGETEELLKLLPYLKDNGNQIISFTKNHTNTLARAASVNIHTGVAQEACPHQLAPTSSTTACMAMGDALTVALLALRDFQPEDFARFHPGGSLGRKLLVRVQDVMVKEDLPFIPKESTIVRALTAITDGGVGAALVGTPRNLEGVFTDGDLRRAFEKFPEKASKMTVEEFMSKEPKVVTEGTRFADALTMMEEEKVNFLLVRNFSQIVGIVKK